MDNFFLVLLLCVFVVGFVSRRYLQINTRHSCRFRDERFSPKNQKNMDFLVLLLCCVGFVSSIPTNMRRQGRRSQAQSLDMSSDGVRDFLSNAEIIFSNERETNENDDENDSKKNKISMYSFHTSQFSSISHTHHNSLSITHTHTHTHPISN